MNKYRVDIIRKLPSELVGVSNLDIDLRIKIDGKYAIQKGFNIENDEIKTTLESSEVKGLNGDYSYEIKANNHASGVLEKGVITIKNPFIINWNLMSNDECGDVNLFEKRLTKVEQATGVVDMTGYAKNEDLDFYARLEDIPDVSGFATEGYVDNQISQIKLKHGKDGKDGIDGAKGEKGEKGDKGPQGEQGPRGEKGEQGLPGAKGKDGKNGKNGKDGERGPQGIQGPQGPPGPAGGGIGGNMLQHFLYPSHDWRTRARCRPRQMVTITPQTNFPNVSTFPIQREGSSDVWRVTEEGITLQFIFVCEDFPNNVYFHVKNVGTNQDYPVATIMKMDREGSGIIHGGETFISPPIQFNANERFVILMKNVGGQEIPQNIRAVKEIKLHKFISGM